MKTVDVYPAERSLGKCHFVVVCRVVDGIYGERKKNIFYLEGCIYSRVTF